MTTADTSAVDPHSAQHSPTSAGQHQHGPTQGGPHHTTPPSNLYNDTYTRHDSMVTNFDSDNDGVTTSNSPTSTAQQLSLLSIHDTQPQHHTSPLIGTQAGQQLSAPSIHDTPPHPPPHIEGTTYLTGDPHSIPTPMGGAVHTSTPGAGGDGPPTIDGPPTPTPTPLSLAHSDMGDPHTGDPMGNTQGHTTTLVNSNKNPPHAPGRPHHAHQ